MLVVGIPCEWDTPCLLGRETSILPPLHHHWRGTRKVRDWSHDLAPADRNKKLHMCKIYTLCVRVCFTCPHLLSILGFFSSRYNFSCFVFCYIFPFLLLSLEEFHLSSILLISCGLRKHTSIVGQNVIENEEEALRGRPWLFQEWTKWVSMDEITGSYFACFPPINTNPALLPKSALLLVLWQWLLQGPWPTTPPALTAPLHPLHSLWIGLALWLWPTECGGGDAGPEF